MAALSGDQRLLVAFAAEEDVHAATARTVLGLPAGVAVTPAQRNMGKTLNFAML